MSLLSKDELLELQEASGPCVSLYMPTHRAGPQTEQDPIRLKNLLSSAEKQLQALADDEALKMLKPARALIDDYDFWQHQSDGLAILLSAEHQKILRLPLEFEELAAVAPRFHLKPLLPLLTEGGRYYVLALSRNHVRLFLATPHRISEVDVGDTVPDSVADALGYDWEQRSLQYHGQRRAAGARREAIYHGHGAGSDDREMELHRFLEILDSGLHEALTKTGRPMVLAGVEEVTAVFRQVSKYPHLVEQTVTGNPDETTAEELQRKAWEAVEPVFRSQRDQAAERFAELQGTGKATDQLDEIVPAACDGRIEIAFVPVGRNVWGHYDPAERTIERVEEPPSAETNDAGDVAVDLLDFAALRSLSTGATVYAVSADDLPGDGDAAAILRY